VTEATTSTSISASQSLERQPEHRNFGGGLRWLAVRGLAAGLAAAAFVAPAATALVSPAAAATKPSLLVQAAAAVVQTDAKEEADHTIPFKKGTKFAITCTARGTNIACSEHSGPERCVNKQPWILLTDVFPVINGRLGESLTYGLTWTYLYCTK
jgi:hypothetical protein